MVERQAKPPIDVRLNAVLLVAEASNLLPGLDGAEFGGRTVFIGAANEKDVVADLSPETRMDIGRKQRANEIAEVFDAVHIGKRTGNENPGHRSDLSRRRMPNPSGIKKPSRETGRAWIRLMPGAKMRALSHPVELHTVGPGHSRREQRAFENHFGISRNLFFRNLHKITHGGKNTRSG